MVQKLIALSAIAPVTVAAILMLGTLAAISTINHVSAQESSNTGNATQESSNTEPLQEMVPAMTFPSFHITNQQQLANGLTEEKPNVDCNRTVCVERAPHTGNAYSPITVTAEELLGRQTSPPSFILAINGKFVSGKLCDGALDTQSVVQRHGVDYTICSPNISTPPSAPPPLCPQTTIPTKPLCHGGS